MHISVISVVSTEGLRSDDELRSLCRNGLTVSGRLLGFRPALDRISGRRGVRNPWNDRRGRTVSGPLLVTPGDFVMAG